MQEQGIIELTPERWLVNHHDDRIEGIERGQGSVEIRFGVGFLKDRQTEQGWVLGAHRIILTGVVLETYRMETAEGDWTGRRPPEDFELVFELIYSSDCRRCGPFVEFELIGYLTGRGWNQVKWTLRAESGFLEWTHRRTHEEWKNGTALQG